jgi:hypothetical protein
MVANSDGRLYQIHRDRKIWRFTGTPCVGERCGGWELLDRNPASMTIVASGGELYQLHRGGRVWQYTGTPCTATACPGWQMLDNNPATTVLTGTASRR